MPRKKPAPAPQGAPDPVQVTLQKGEYRYFNWVLAFERPILPFFLYTFVLVNLASLLGVWPDGRVFGLAILPPLLGYAIWVHTTAGRVWKAYPAIQRPRTYRFGEESYTVQGEEREEIPWSRVDQALVSRRGVYLLRSDGSADILPKAAAGDFEALVGWVQARVTRMKRSSFL